MIQKIKQEHVMRNDQTGTGNHNQVPIQTVLSGSKDRYLITIMIKTEKEIPLPIDKVTIIKIRVGRVYISRHNIFNPTYNLFIEQSRQIKTRLMQEIHIIGQKS